MKPGSGGTPSDRLLFYTEGITVAASGQKAVDAVQVMLQTT
jgi:hypothetical protein